MMISTYLSFSHSISCSVNKDKRHVVGSKRKSEESRHSQYSTATNQLGIDEGSIKIYQTFNGVRFEN